MGVTIHFEGRLRNAESLRQVIEVASAFARKEEWRTESISAPERKLARVRDEENWDYVGPVEGVAFYTAEDCEPVRLEFDRDLYLQEFTQARVLNALPTPQPSKWLIRLVGIFGLIGVVAVIYLVAYSLGALR